MPFTVDGT